MERRNFADENKTQIIEWFISDDELCRAMINNEKNYLDIKVTDDQKDALIFNQIFPYKFIPDITIDSKSYITMSFNYIESRANNLFLISDLAIWCFCHRDLIRTKYKYLRYDFMKQRVCDILQDKWSDNWFGKMKLNPPREMAIDENVKYYGVQLNFANEVLK